MNNIRLLKADEIECRVQSTKKTKNGVGCILLLYKDARCDMKILDEVFGILGWEREHHLINGNLFCTVRVWDLEKEMWISKQDVGTESNTEKEKGQASDSFKRACFNLGIGRELYTAPFIWINLNDDEYSESNNKIQVIPFVKFQIKSIGYNDQREITSLEIIDSKGNSRFKLGQKSEAPRNDEKPQQTGKAQGGKLSDKQVDRAIKIGQNAGISLDKIKKTIIKDYNVTEIADLTKQQYDELCSRLEKAANKEATA